LTALVDWTRRELPRLEAIHDVADVLGYALEHAAPRGLWLEFGVAAGMSLQRIAHAAKFPHARPEVVGFDSFKGLPEAWVWNHSQHLAAGTFAQDKIPVVPGAEIVVGLFQDTLPTWLELQRQGADVKEWRPVTLVHVDCDLYSSARFVLAELAPALANGAIVVFDELVGYHGFDAHEWRALFETTAVEDRFAFEWLARNARGQQVAITVTRKDEAPWSPRS
jgi:hypothetical protein